MTPARYYLRGARGYIQRPTQPPAFTAYAQDAYHWASSEAAHTARKAYSAISASYDDLVVVVRDATTTRLYA
jgi:hypothetical protein